MVICFEEFLNSFLTVITNNFQNSKPNKATTVSSTVLLFFEERLVLYVGYTAIYIFSFEIVTRQEFPFGSSGTFFEPFSFTSLRRLYLLWLVLILLKYDPC